MQAGNVISGGDYSQYLIQGVDLRDGRRGFKVAGVAKVTSSPQTVLDVRIYPPRNVNVREDYPPIPIVLPLGAEILSASLRLPSYKVQDEFFQYGKHIPQGCNIVGTAGDVLKVSFTGANTITLFATAKTAAITCGANGRYVPFDNNRIARRNATADDATGILNTLTAPQTINLVVANAANTAAGTGISLSVANESALIPVDVLFALPDDSVFYREIHSIGKKGFFA